MKKFDVARVMLMCLIHDVVEIDAGDTYAYDAEGLKTQKARRRKPKSGCIPCSRRTRRLT